MLNLIFEDCVKHEEQTFFLREASSPVTMFYTVVLEHSNGYLFSRDRLLPSALGPVGQKLRLSLVS